MEEKFELAESRGMIKEIGTEDAYDKYEYWFEYFDKYANKLSGAKYSRVDEEGNTTLKNYSKLEAIS